MKAPLGEEEAAVERLMYKIPYSPRTGTSAEKTKSTIAEAAKMNDDLGRGGWHCGLPARVRTCWETGGRAYERNPGGLPATAPGPCRPAYFVSWIPIFRPYDFRNGR